MFGTQHQNSGETLLSHEESESLLLPITTRSELNLAEAINILEAFRFYENKPFKIEELLDDAFVRELHKRMFSSVWTWAGKYRTRDLNIGIPYEFISTQLHGLMQDSKYWLSNFETTRLIASSCQIHHKLVAIHPFYNGKGRMARLFTDLINRTLNLPEFNWGKSNLEVAGTTRNEYIAALRTADNGNYEALFEFVTRKK